MPWIGRRDSEKVIPEEVEDGETVKCIDCGEEMFPRGPMSDGRSRHFVHHGDIGGSGCVGGEGESDIHRKLKSQAVSGLKHRFSEEYDLCEPEVKLDVTNTPSSEDTRRADALVAFEGRHSVLGEGLIIEVQYRNRGKNTAEVTADYLELGYSVLWVTPDDFESDRLDVDSVTDRITLFSEDADGFRGGIQESANSLPQEQPADQSVSESDSGHPEPNFTDCSHGWKEIHRSGSATGEFICRDCGSYFWKHNRIGYISNNEMPKLFRPKFEGCGIWRVEEDGYFCIGCGEWFD